LKETDEFFIKEVDRLKPPACVTARGGEKLFSMRAPCFHFGFRRIERRNPTVALRIPQRKAPDLIVQVAIDTHDLQNFETGNHQDDRSEQGRKRQPCIKVLQQRQRQSNRKRKQRNSKQEKPNSSETPVPIEPPQHEDQAE